jgi:hypothetical protein
MNDRESVVTRPPGGIEIRERSFPKAQSSKRRRGIRDHIARDHTAEQAEHPHHGFRKIIIVDSIAYMPNDGTKRQSAGDSSEDVCLQRVRVNQLHLVLPDKSREAHNVRQHIKNLPNPEESRNSQRIFLGLAHARSQWQYVRLDVRPESFDEGAIGTQNNDWFYGIRIQVSDKV